MRTTIVTSPTIEPVFLEDAKDHLRVDGTDEDTLISDLIVVAREWCEGYQNRAYLTQTWKLVLDDWPDDYIRIPKPPLQSVTHVKYIDSAGTQSTWSSSLYIVDTASRPGRIVPAYSQTWPSVTLQPINAIEVQFVAGFGDSLDDVPARVKHAIKLIVGHLYENRESTAIQRLHEVPMAVYSLLGLDRIWPL